MEASALRAPAGLTRLALPGALLRLRSDEQLVALFRQGNEDAFRVIHDRYRQRLFAYTRQMLGGSRSDAEDALQDVFLRAYNALRVDERPVALKAWLYRVAHNRCVDHLRRPTPPPADVFDLSRQPMPDPLAEAERRDDLRRLVADVRRLPDQQRSALLMRELEGLSYADLATALDVSIPAIKSLLVRARIGLVEAAEARDTACAEIRDDLALSFGKGVRASALARRHMRECDGCRDYRSRLRTVSSGLNSLSPGGHHPLALVAKLLGVGGAGSSAAAGGGGAAAGGGSAIVGGGVVTATTAKVAAIVCSAALATGTAAEIKHSSRTAEPAKRSAAAKPAALPAMQPEHIRSASPAGAAAVSERMSQAVATRRAEKRAALKRKRAAAAEAVAAEDAISTHVASADDDTVALKPVRAVQDSTGGVLAPDDDTSASSDDTGSGSSATGDGTSTASSGSTTGSGSGSASGEPTAVPAVATDPADGSSTSGSSSGSTSGTSGSSSSGTTQSASGTQPPPPGRR